MLPSMINVQTVDSIAYTQNSISFYHNSELKSTLYVLNNEGIRN